MRVGVLALLGASGCAGLGLVGWPASPAVAVPVEAPARVRLTVVVADGVGEAAAVEAAVRRDLGRGFDLVFAPAPNAPPADPAPSAVETKLVAARRAYVDAQFRVCGEAVAGDALPFELVARGERTLAARVLFWRVACRVGAGAPADAAPDALALVTMGLDVPADVEAATPEVEAIIALARTQVSSGPRLPLRVTASTAASVSVDGRAPGCVAPCSLDLAHGEHVVRLEADGFAPAWRRVRVVAGVPVLDVPLEPASPELAAEQWTRRHARGDSPDSAASLTLLARALRARRLALVAVEPKSRPLRLRAALAVDGAVAARSERVVDGGTPRAAAALVRDLLVRGQLVEPAPPLVRRPVFWVVVGAAVLVAAGTTALLLYDPPIETEVGF